MNLTNNEIRDLLNWKFGSAVPKGASEVMMEAFGVIVRSVQGEELDILSILHTHSLGSNCLEDVARRLKKSTTMVYGVYYRTLDRLKRELEKKIPAATGA